MNASRSMALMIMMGVSHSAYSASDQLGLKSLIDRQKNQPVASTSSGKVAGFVTGNGVSAFLGIPFAQPPKGDLRFAAPVPIEPWRGVRPATQFGFSCPQGKDPAELASLLPQDEDCLTLNIWTPKADAQKRPVIVYLHGGGFLSGGTGDPTYDGAVFSKRGDLVFASINYRVQAFGFLYLDEFGEQFKGSGANGIRDQLLGLRWLKANLARFGGDPENITIMGESAGSISGVTLLSLPQAKGLFQKAITESGSSNVLRTKEQAALLTKQFFQLAGITDIAGLRKLTPAQFGEINKKQKALIGVFAARMYAPVVDGAVIPREPLTAIQEGAAAGIPLLNGVNRDEFSYYIQYFPALRTTPLRQFFMGTPQLQGKLQGREAEILAFYQQNNPPEGKIAAIPAFVTDLVFFVPHVRLSEAQSHHAPVWMYRFEWPSQVHAYLGACHAIELAFVFKTFDSPLTGEIVGPTPPMGLSDMMQDAWIAFARTGNPNHKGMPAWPTYDAQRRATMIFNAESKVMEDPNREARQLFTGISF